MTWRRPRMDGVATTEGGGGNGRGPRWRWPMADPAEGEKSFVMEQHLFLLRLDLQKELLGELFHCCRPLLFQLCRQPHLQELQLKQHIGQRRHHSPLLTALQDTKAPSLRFCK
ncbi:uncharacterized protein LOC127753160 isoform X4 [Oryza glaberrima]|uniref:uncharacterized protein LOC127753160 isoform X4 n=1 Tax=Oryza glaberrima TaxID=4538 RepID=UPI00224C362F|nr:uncharacterized protein LOC127753160 isoform X4 [Oryza glaberrima]